MHVALLADGERLTRQHGATHSLLAGVRLCSSPIIDVPQHTPALENAAPRQQPLLEHAAAPERAERPTVERAAPPTGERTAAAAVPVKAAPEGWSSSFDGHAAKRHRRAVARNISGSYKSQLCSI